LTERPKPLERALEDAVSRALRDNLTPLQRTADELHQAYADLVASCSSSRPTNALPAMLRAQTAASALAAGLSVLSNFVAVALNPRDRDGAGETAGEAVENPASATQTAVAEPEPPPPAPVEKPAAPAEPESESAAEEPPLVPVEPEPEPQAEAAAPAAAAPAPSAPAETAFDVASLSQELQELHRRANRVAKVTMQDIKLLHPNDVRLGQENKDICSRLRSDLDKARKEYDRRFRAILDQPVDYFHRWMVEILAEGDSAALGEYPYPSPVLRQ
jgi:outer membrane biosynthesis protein TonB